MNHFTRQHGLTLIELLAVLAILVILFGVAKPGFTAIVERFESRSQMNGLYHLFQQGRSAAVMENTLVTICPLDQDRECSRDWNTPIYVFLDPGNERALTDTGAQIAKRQPPNRGRLHARPTWKSYFQFKPDGTANHAIGNITYCPQTGVGNRAGRVTVSWGGRLRFIRGDDSDITCA